MEKDPKAPTFCCVRESGLLLGKKIFFAASVCVCVCGTYRVNQDMGLEPGKTQSQNVSPGLNSTLVNFSAGSLEAS